VTLDAERNNFSVYKKYSNLGFNFGHNLHLNSFHIDENDLCYLLTYSLHGVGYYLKR
jgi:hypothetical protein